ncbi:hypothetical protein DSY4984 [Desulfitobacterium hafniense Y51]|uniref:Uncharacterized protein n=1 Tax=Desulfitobacterium hafniense (strain Y51) TaxID=138119 RepID=Q24MG9_DESHY|nr:hypothetical protein DSY4984 [Desulfitobacterium hafniense Y51]
MPLRRSNRVSPECCQFTVPDLFQSPESFNFFGGPCPSPVNLIQHSYAVFRKFQIATAFSGIVSIIIITAPILFKNYFWEYA